MRNITPAVLAQVLFFRIEHTVADRTSAWQKEIQHQASEMGKIRNVHSAKLDCLIGTDIKIQKNLL
jgi:hypothetical protein